MPGDAADRVPLVVRVIHDTRSTFRQKQTLFNSLLSSYLPDNTVDSMSSSQATLSLVTRVRDDSILRHTIQLSTRLAARREAYHRT